MLGTRTNELHVMLGENLGKARVFREKPVARMHGVGTRNLTGCEQRRNVEVAVLSGRRANADAFVGEPYMHRVRVRRRVYRHCGNAEFFARPQDAQRDFSSVGNEDFIEHGSQLRR